MKRFSVFLCICLLFVALTVTTALAGEMSTTAISLDLAAGSVEIYESEGVTYCVQNEVTQATTGGVLLRQTNSGTVASPNTVTVSGGSCKVTISSLNIEVVDYSSPISVATNAVLDLTLLGSSTVAGGRYHAGIQVLQGATIIIDGSGSILATGGSDSAGIGGNSSMAEGGGSDAGTITINGGTITAIGPYGTGIGGGDVGSGGSITINGGNVTATGSNDCAGIGGGIDDCTVTINGGIVTASGGHRGAGIGGNVTITGGTVYATGGSQAAGIGDGGSITISGGAITAKGGSGGGLVGHGGAGIGSRNGNNSGIVTITGGTVIASGGRYSPDIGADSDDICAAVTITENATVTDEEGNAPYVVETIFIDKQPLSSAAHLGKTPASFLTAHGHSGLSYQWELSSDNENWSELEGETSASTSSFSVTEELNGSYIRCKLTNGWGNVEYTDSVQIYVLAYAKQPTNVEANLNDIVAFEATSTCSNVVYQWQRSYDEGATWSNVPGETFSTIIVNATLSESSAKYRCVITATNGDQLASDVVSVNLDLGDLVTYTVQDFWQNIDGSGYAVTSQQVLEGLSGTSVTAPDADCDGFTLNTGKSILSGTVTEDSSLVLTRYFDRNTYAITFDTNGGSALPDLKALYGASIQGPSVPSRYGHVFDGWYADEDLTEEYIFDTMPLGGATVYAKWAPVGADRGIEYTINGLAIRDSNTFEPLDEIPEDNFLVEVSITNLEATETDTILLVYYTDEGQMLGMNYMFANTAAGQTVTFGASVNNADGEVRRICAFVLPSLGNPTPLARSAEIR